MKTTTIDYEKFYNQILERIKTEKISFEMAATQTALNNYDKDSKEFCERAKIRYLAFEDLSKYVFETINRLKESK